MTRSLATVTLPTVALSTLLAVSTAATADQISGPYFGVSVEPITHIEDDGDGDNDFYFESIDMRAGFGQVLSNSVYVGGEGLYNLKGIETEGGGEISEAYGVNGKLGLALQENLVVYGIAGFAMAEFTESDGELEDDEGIGYGAGVTYGLTDNVHIMGEATTTSILGADIMAAKIGVAYRFDL